MHNETKEGMEIDLRKLLGALMQRWWVFVICIVLAVVVSFYYTKTLVTPMYRASVTIYVNNVRADQQVNYITSTNLATAQKLVSTYIEIIQSNTVLEKVIKESGYSITPRQIRSVMSAMQKGETELFDIFIVHRDPAQAQHLANAIAEVAPGEIERFVEGSSAKIVDYAKLPTEPATPNVRQNIILGALIGFLIAAVYVTLRFMMDVRIREEEDLVALFAIPVLGQIPSFDQIGTKKQRKGKGYEYVADIPGENNGKKGKK